MSLEENYEGEMSIPEKEFLSKKKCIYEVICFSDGRISVERRAVAYLNQSYVYVIVPGDDELHKVLFSRIHDSEDIKTVLDDLSLAKRRSFEAWSYFWDRPDTSDKHMVDAKKSYFQNRINDLLKELDKIEIKYELERGLYKKKIKNYMKQLEKVEEAI